MKGEEEIFGEDKNRNGKKKVQLTKKQYSLMQIFVHYCFLY